MRFQHLSDWLSWLEQLHPVEIELGLARVQGVADRLGIKDFPGTVITVAGTNGKGSTIAALAAVLSLPHANRPTPQIGVYTSPHLVRFNERIVVNGRQVGDQTLCDAFERIDQARLQPEPISLSYFEFTTLAALLIFADQPLDYVLLEVGLGGRLDAVNIIDPDIAIITRIGIDHQSWLGDTREQIALEKAGILRAGQRVIVADHEPPLSLQRRILELQCYAYWPLQCAAAGSLESVEKTGAAAGLHGFASDTRQSETLHWQGCDSDGECHNLTGLPLPALAQESWSAALQAALLVGVSLNDAVSTSSQLSQLMADQRLPGRLYETRYEERRFLLDVAHNPDAVARLHDYLAAGNATATGRTVAIFGVMADKDLEGILAAAGDVFSHWYLPQLSDCPRSAAPQALQQIIFEHTAAGQDTVKLSQSVEDSIIAAIQSTAANDKIVVFGSFITVGEALKCIDSAF